ncbi:MAG TPA: Flp family type IVb pilin [Nocardioides sp.]|nr:Flp family type IVb pilin [Nocardioides sp.]HRD63808.1 Flp family type IVb pilin [Nocardioides sp.]HRI97386.1 Flp family type IVb pilin [Nocardioides sp.]HRK47015.1 Flp family type IVb pilin [Nocardioides sp.]
MSGYLRSLLGSRTTKDSERGASAVEYGLLIAGIAALIVVVVFAFGGSLKGIFTNTCSKVTASATTKSCS